MFKLDDEKKQPKVLSDIMDEIENEREYAHAASWKMFPHGRAIIYN